MEPTTPPTGPTIGDDEATHRADERRRRALEWSAAHAAALEWTRPAADRPDGPSVRRWPADDVA